MDEFLFSFNPTLVRLRPLIISANVDVTRRFQSHAGSIEAGNRERQLLKHREFQSHAGSIEAVSPTSMNS